MFYSLKGVVESVADDFAVLEVQGVGYQVFADARTLAQLAVGEAGQMFIYTHVREDHIHLYGFNTLEMRQVFETLLKVSGVGTKMALAIFNVMTPADIASALTMQDATPFTQASGVGKKLAERIVLELKGKLKVSSIEGVNGGMVQQETIGLAGEVISALVNLGYKAPQAQRAVKQTLNDLPNGAFEDVFKESLKALR